jgi:hypothetical protein
VVLSRGAPRNDAVEIEVGNPCPTSTQAEAHGNLHAQDSIALRLKHHFGSRAQMTTSSRNGYYAVRLWLPLD